MGYYPISLVHQKRLGQIVIGVGQLFGYRILFNRLNKSVSVGSEGPIICEYPSQIVD